MSIKTRVVCNYFSKSVPLSLFFAYMYGLFSPKTPYYKYTSHKVDSTSQTTSSKHGYLDFYCVGLGLLAALPPPLFNNPAKNEANASFWGFPSGEVTFPPGVDGSGVW
jgi:hypothetical protein